MQVWRSWFLIWRFCRQVATMKQKLAATTLQMSDLTAELAKKKKENAELVRSLSRSSLRVLTVCAGGHLRLARFAARGGRPRGQREVGSLTHLAISLKTKGLGLARNLVNSITQEHHVFRTGGHGQEGILEQLLCCRTLLGVLGEGKL